MKTLAKIALATASTLLAAAPASAQLSGDYTVTFFSGPSHSNTGTQCIVFTQTGNVDGFSNSGTWDSSTFGGWGGNFIVDGTDLRWYGTFNSGANVTNFHNKIARGIPKKGGFDDWAVSGVSASNDGTTKLVSGCADTVISHSNDPTRR